MKKQVIIRAAATTALALSLTGAMASADILGPTGPDSTNNVSSNFSNSQSVSNDNDLGLSSNNGQHASTGDATAAHNTGGGNAQSGAATNGNGFGVDASVTNSSAAALGQLPAPSMMGSMNIGKTGPDSSNTISSTVSNVVSVSNNNDVHITSNNQQSAYSGDATVADNTDGGSAISGAATNTNNTTVGLHVQN